MSARVDYNVLLYVFTLSFFGSFAALYEGDKCSLQTGSEGKCKLLKECPTAVIPLICGFVETELIVCCKDGEKVTITTNTTTPTNRVASRIPGDISKQKCKEYAEYAYDKIEAPTLLLKPHFTKKLVCDFPRSKLVVGATLASRRQFPHMTLIGYQEYDNVVWLCGGSLISENFVLTAAHCLISPLLGPAKLVRVGSTNKIDFEHMQERTISEVIRHVKFNNTLYNDIGLLKLSKNVKLNTYVRPACLHAERYIPYDLAVASGWGKSEANNNLLEIVLELFSAKKCNHTYSRFNLFTNRLKDGIIDDLMICAGTSQRGKDTCEGGGVGGPLQVYHEETEDVKCMYDIIGVITFGESCGLRKDSPGVFTRVSTYIKWIEDTVWPD